MKLWQFMSVIVITAGVSACNNIDSAPQVTSDSSTQKTASMNNMISIVEIPVTDFSRAIKFYSEILDISIEEMKMDGNQMGVFPADEKTVNVVLIKGSGYKPTSEGALLYLNAGSDLQPSLDKIEKNGGHVILPKTEISPEMGYFALFMDTEGNKLGLHSRQ